MTTTTRTLKIIISPEMEDAIDHSLPPVEGAESIGTVRHQLPFVHARKRHGRPSRNAGRHLTCYRARLEIYGLDLRYVEINDTLIVIGVEDATLDENVVNRKVDVYLSPFEDGFWASPDEMQPEDEHLATFGEAALATYRPQPK